MSSCPQRPRPSRRDSSQHVNRIVTDAFSINRERTRARPPSVSSGLIVFRADGGERMTRLSFHACTGKAVGMISANVRP
jgi:hypothetical protein